MTRQIEEYLEKLLLLCEKKKISVSDIKELEYGIQMKFQDQQAEIPLNIYFSEKKGISTLIGGKKENPLKPLISNLLLEIKRADKFHNWKVWVGTDESGKGDFFGPLVVTAFAADSRIADQLLKWDVKDSKMLSSSKIENIAKKLFHRYSANIDYIVLKPLKYNDLYRKFTLQNKKLNELLAWMHARVILNLHKKINFQGAIVDKFAHDRTLNSGLKDLKKIDIINKVRAEQDPAVAAASIISRYLYLKEMNSLSKEFDLILPKGASQSVIDAADSFAAKFRKEELIKVAKIHFKTYDKVRSNNSNDR